MLAIIRGTGPMILGKAKDFSELLKIDHFEPNNVWLGQWKNKENFSFHHLQGEKSAFDKEGGIIGNIFLFTNMYHVTNLNVDST